MSQINHYYFSRPALVEGDEVNTVYADLMTFIMMLFILLFILSYNNKKESDFFVKMQTQMTGNTHVEQPVLTTDYLLVSQLQNFIQVQQLKSHTQILVDEQKIKLVFNTPTLFESGSATLTPDTQNMLMGLMKILKNVDNPIMIEGHTDNIPIKTDRYESNWDLSFHRAYAVLRFMVSQLNYTPETLSATGYGQYRPIATNDTIMGRAKNRRIEINIIRITKAENLE
jgi:chemotaxis protein MotB